MWVCINKESEITVHCSPDEMTDRVLRFSGIVTDVTTMYTSSVLLQMTEL